MAKLVPLCTATHYVGIGIRELGTTKVQVGAEFGVVPTVRVLELANFLRKTKNAYKQPKSVHGYDLPFSTNSEIKRGLCTATLCALSR